MRRTPRPSELPTKHELATAAATAGRLHHDAVCWAIGSMGASYTVVPASPSSGYAKAWHLINQKAASVEMVLRRLWGIDEAYAATFDIAMRLAMADVRIVTRAGAVQCAICRRAHPCDLRHKDDCAYVEAVEWATKLSEEALTQDGAGAGASQ